MSTADPSALSVSEVELTYGDLRRLQLNLFRVLEPTYLSGANLFPSMPEWLSERATAVLQQRIEDLMGTADYLCGLLPPEPDWDD